MIVYGIKNCNTVKSALHWLKENKIEFEFHDFKTKGISEAKLKDWCSQKGWDTLLNKRGTTWRQLLPETQLKVLNESTAIALMKNKTSVIKRPVIESEGAIIALGFEPDLYRKVMKI